jgi:hypothetical protein
MAKSLLSAFPNKFDLFSFVPFIHDEDAAVQTCYDLGLVANVLVCAHGHGVMSRWNEPGPWAKVRLQMAFVTFTRSGIYSGIYLVYL